MQIAQSHAAKGAMTAAAAAMQLATNGTSIGNHNSHLAANQVSSAPQRLYFIFVRINKSL